MTEKKEETFLIVIPAREVQKWHEYKKAVKILDKSVNARLLKLIFQDYEKIMLVQEIKKVKRENKK
jgi:hypothetical protein